MSGLLGYLGDVTEDYAPGGGPAVRFDENGVSHIMVCPPYCGDDPVYNNPPLLPPAGVIPTRPTLPRPTPTRTLPPGTTAGSISEWLQTSTAILGVAIPNFVLLAGGIVGAVFLSKGK